MKNFFAQTKAEINRILGKSYDDKMSESDVIEDLQATDPVGEATETNTENITALEDRLEQAEAQGTQNGTSLTELQGKLDEANETIEAQGQTITALTGRLDALEKSSGKHTEQIKNLSGEAAGEKAKGSARAGATGQEESKSQKAFKEGVREITNESKH